MLAGYHCCRRLGGVSGDRIVGLNLVVELAQERLDCLSVSGIILCIRIRCGMEKRTCPEIQILYSNSTGYDNLIYAKLSLFEMPTTTVDMGSLSSKYLNQLLSHGQPVCRHVRCRGPDFHSDPNCARKSLSPHFLVPPTIPLLVRCLPCISQCRTMHPPLVDRLEETPSFPPVQLATK